MWWVRHIRSAQLHCPLDGAIDKRNGQRKHLKRSENRVPGRFSVRKEKKLWQDGHWKTAHRSQKPCYVFQSMPYRGASAFSFAFNNQSSPFSLSGLISGVVSPNCASKTESRGGLPRRSNEHMYRSAVVSTGGNKLRDGWGQKKVLCIFSFS